VKEWDDFADDDRIYKKFKKGKISKEQYEKLLLQMK
jgi:ATP-dependent RNA helicase DDX55/SPB4